MKGIQKTTRFLLLLLVLAMMLSVFAACTTEDEEIAVTTTEDPAGTEDPTGPGVYVDDNLPDDLNFGDEFLILSSVNQKGNYWAEETDTAPVAQAIYKRNETVEERLGITLEWDHQPCSSSHRSERDAFVQRAETDYSSGNHNYDCVVSYNLTPYVLASKNLAVNLNDTTYIDLEMPYWPDEYLSNMLYQDKIFALVDNASVGTLTNLACIFFNNERLEAKNIESPYDLVANNEWTIAKLKELIKGTYEGVNTDGKEDLENDIYGLATSTAARLTCWYYGAGLRFSSIDENGELVLNTDVEAVTNTIEAIVDLFSTEDSAVVDKSQFKMFREKRVYFYLSTVTTCVDLANKGIEVDYGVVPQPKLNSEQSRYYTHIPNSHDAWYLIKGTRDLDCSSAFIECMASEAYRQVNKVFFEDTIKLRYAPDEKLAVMYDLIRESITFDFIYIYKNVTSEDIDAKVRNCIRYPDQYKWATVWAGIKEGANTDFQTVLNIYKN